MGERSELNTSVIPRQRLARSTPPRARDIQLPLCRTSDGRRAGRPAVMGAAPIEPKKRKLKRTDDATNATKAARTAEKEPEPLAAAAADEAVIKAAKKAAKKAALAAGASEAEAKAAGKAAAKAAKKAAKAVGAPVASAAAEGSGDDDELAYRAKLQITAGELGDASTLPPCNRSFESTPFVPGVVAALSSSFDAPTPIQAQSWPILTLSLTLTLTPSLSRNPKP